MVLTKEPMGNVTKRLLNVLQIALNFLCTSLSDHSVLMLIPLEGWLWFWLLFGFLNIWVCCSTIRFTQATQGVGFTFLLVLVLLLQFVLCFVSLNTNNNCAFHSSQLLQYLSLTCIIRSLLTLKMHNAWLTFRSITDSKLFLRVLAVINAILTCWKRFVNKGSQWRIKRVGKI